MNSKPTTAEKPATPSIKSKTKSIPEGMHSITPHLVCDGAANAIEFYKGAFNAVELLRIPSPQGKLMHAAIRIGDSAVMLVDEFPEWGSFGPKALKGSSVTVHLYVKDVDAVVERAVRAGAKVTMPVEDMFWGDRYGRIEDPFGHQWSLATHIRDMSPEEMRRATPTMCGQEQSKTNTADEEFVVTRVFNAPRDTVFNAWSESARLAEWWGPKGFSISVAKFDLRPGGVFHYGMKAANGHEMWGKFIYREVAAPERLVFVVSFSTRSSRTSDQRHRGRMQNIRGCI